MARRWARINKQGAMERMGSADDLDLSGDGWEEVDEATFDQLRDAEAKRNAPRQAEEDFRAGASKALADPDEEAVRRIASGGRAQDFSDAKMDGLSSPTARAKQDWGDATRNGASMAGTQLRQDWTDGPRNPSPMPRAGTGGGQAAKAPGSRTSVRAGMSGAARSAAPLPRPPALERIATKYPEVAGYMLQRNGTPPDGLTQARNASNKDLFGVRLARAGAMFNQGVTGARMDNAAWDDLEKSSNQPLEDLETGRRMMREDEESYESSRERRLREQSTQQGWATDARNFDYRQQRDTADDTLARDRMDAEERRAAEQRRFQWASLAEQRAGRADNAAARAEERRAAAEQKEEARTTRTREKDMAELAKRTDKLAQTKSDVETVNGYMREGGDIPGAGVWDSVKMENTLLRGVFASEDDTKSWQASQRMAANYLNTMTGQSFTPLEAERTLGRYGVRAGATEQEWRAGMSAFIRDVKSGLVQKEAAFKHVVPEFRRRGGITAEDIPEPAEEEPTPTGKVFTLPDGRRFIETSNGKARPL